MSTTITPPELASDDRLLGAYPEDEAPEETLSPLSVAITVLRHRRLIALTAFIFFLIAVVPLTFGERTYTSGGTYIPKSSNSPGGIMGLAASLGADVPLGSMRDNPAFYVELMKSRDVLEPVLLNVYTYHTKDGIERHNLLDILGVQGSPELKMERGLKLFGKLVTVNEDNRTGVVSYSVEQSYPDLAQQVAAKLYEETNRANLEMRQAEASNDRRFGQERLKELRAELQAAEDRLQNFAQNNRDYKNSPPLALDYERLVRDLSFRQTVYESIAQTYENARIEAARNTPVIMPIDPPNVPARPNKRGRVRAGLIALILGSAAGLAIGLGRDAMARNTSGNEKMVELKSLLRETVADVRKPWRMRRAAAKNA